MTGPIDDEFWRRYDAERAAWWEAREKQRKRATQIALKMLVEAEQNGMVQWTDVHQGSGGWERRRTVRIVLGHVEVAVTATIEEFER